MTGNDCAATQAERARGGISCPIAVQIVDGYTIHCKEDGYDYLGLFNRLLRNEVPKKTLLYDDPEHFAYLVEEDGRSFVFKRFGEFDGKLDTKVWRYFAGPFYSSLMKKVNHAVANGCTVIPDMYLVAEKMSGRLACDNYLLIEFIPGRGVNKLPDPAAYKSEIVAGFAEMHRHGLALGNVKLDHLILTDGGSIKIIDLSSRGSHLIGRAKDAVRVKKILDFELPSCSFVDRLLRLCVGANLWYARIRRKVKATLGIKKY